MGHRHRQLRIRQLQEPDSVVLGDGLWGLHRVVAGLFQDLKLCSRLVRSEATDCKISHLG